MTNLEWARNTTETLYRLGLKNVCISPGSRNTPLTLAFIEHKKINCYSIIDERSSGFFALGLAKSSQNPVALITTSGTATANLYPSIIEANLSRVPLLILTADRPLNLIGTGENQTINQYDIYGHQVRSFIDIGLPGNLKHLIVVLKKSYYLTLGLDFSGNYINPKGPVHLNFPFDEPLINESEINQQINTDSKKYDILKISNVDYFSNGNAITSEILNKVFSQRNLIIVCGEGLNYLELNYLVKFSKKCKIPILADILSNLRFKFDSKYILVNYENYLDKTNKFDLILRFGKKPNSRFLNHFLKKNKDKICLFDPIGRFNDDVLNIYPFSISNFPLEIDKMNQNDFNSVLFKFENNYFYKTDNYVQKILKFIPNNSQLFISNSMPIREFDKMSFKLNKNIDVLGNRGASGIDGIISSAIGMAKANDEKNTILIIGDVSFFYDLNALQLIKKYDVKLTIFVINNNGGQIFNKLPYSNYGIPDFKQFWITNPELNIKQVADLFKLNHTKIKNINHINDSNFESQLINELIIP